MSGNICSDLGQPWPLQLLRTSQCYGSAWSMNDASLDDVQHYLPRCSDAEPNCGIEGLQGHWIKDTLNPQTYLESWRLTLQDIAALLPLYLVSHVPLGALCWVSLAIVNACLHHPLIVESSEPARLIEQLMYKLIRAIWLYLQVYTENCTVTGIYEKNLTNTPFKYFNLN